MTGTVVLVNPQLPNLVPLAAAQTLTRAFYFTEELTSAIANLAHAQPITESISANATLLSSDIAHAAVAAHIRSGAQVIAAERPTGLDVLDTVALIDHLRRAGPWESEQTHESLLRYLVEETYELADAVAALDAPHAGTAQRAELRSELGDLLLQVVFHARIAEDAHADAFTIDDVARTLTEKVRRRTPHLADGAHVDVATQARNWERQKRAEYQARGSVLDSIATSQPALALADKIFERLRAANFPTDLIPHHLRTVSVDPDRPVHFAELQYRRRLLDFIDTVRRAETLIADGEQSTWTNAWESVRNNTVE